MLSSYFQNYPLPFDQYNGFYDIRLVILSYLVAVFASYIALDFTGRLKDRNNTKTGSLLWLISGSIAMGAGIWSMHFIGMLSFTIPGLTLQYGLFWTGLSLIVAILVSGFALSLLKNSLLNVTHLIAGGVILGIGIASMHYTGMEGLLVTLNVKYLPTLFFLSILVAILASEAAIWLALKSNKVILRFRNRIKLISAMIMGLAICGMHYIGMWASVMSPLCAPSLASTSGSLDPTVLAMAVAGVTLIILAIALFASSYKEALNQQQFEQARQLGMAEIAASVLHNVGNVLNSVNVSANAIAETFATSKLETLNKLCVLLNKHKDDLGSFVTNDPQGKNSLEFINSLNEAWEVEKLKMKTEIALLLHHTSLIKEIIYTQQSFSKQTGIENILSINELLEEALLVTGIVLKEEIKIERNYQKIPATISDKVKLLQVLVNILNNAKDALLESPNSHKLLIIKTSLIKNQILIEITDSGIGIRPENIKRIFNYGYTTKHSGHGFGLHSSAIAINELGGEIEVKSAGSDKGATFLLTLPFKKPL